MRMTASRILQRHWSGLPDSDVAAQMDAAQHGLRAFSRVTRASGSLIQSWVRGAEIVELDHYPPNDVIDSRRGSQFFYHAHRSNGNEHGHLHLFWHATSSGRRRHVPEGTRWVRSAPSHLLAIALDNRGLPVTLFTVNRWVTDGHWFDSATTLAMVDRFAMGDVRGHTYSCRWLNAFIRLYRPVIAELFEKRDKALTRVHPAESRLDNRKLEQLSAISIDWSADLAALEGEVQKRRETARLLAHRR